MTDITQRHNLIELTIDPEFQTLIPSLSKEEYSGLEESIVSEGCRDALVAWNGILVDGHNRFEICTKHHIQFRVVSKEFPDREGAIDWMCTNQLARRNLGPEMISYLRGKQYEIRKKREWSRHPVGDQNDPLPKTAEKIAQEQHVSAPTVKRDADFAKAVDAVGESLGQDVKQKILSGEINVSKSGVIDAAKLNGLFTSDSEEWYTPQEILDAVYATFENGIDVDPCSPVGNPRVDARARFTKDDDGLKQSWKGTVFMNPPYGNVIGDWVKKALDEYKSGNAKEIIILVPARTDTAWFQTLVDWPWCGVKGRLKFSDNKNSAPFPSAIFYIGENLKAFFECFEQFGPVFRKVCWEEADVS
jgi:hypothetical protein